jgi:protease IV
VVNSSPNWTMGRLAMCRLFISLALILIGTGCERFLTRTQSKLSNILAPVNPNAGPMQPILVESGVCSIRVAIVDVDGLILNTPFVGPMSVGENPVAVFREKLEAIERDPCVKAVVLRINSPGGGVAACQAMRRDLEKFKQRTHLPVVSCLMDVGTGGAYYLASAADSVVAGPTSVMGGIGVILNLFNLRDLMAQFNIIPQGIKAGEYVDIGSSARSLEPAEKALLQAMADEFHKQLQTDIAQSRSRIDLAGGTTFDGRIFTGNQALARGLIDQIGDLDDAIQLATQLSCPGGLNGVRPQVILYRRTNDPANSIYAITANIPLQGAGLLPNLPGLDRTKLPTFMSVWEPELTIEKLGGK